MEDCTLCSSGNGFCTCPDRKAQDTEVALAHWLSNFEPAGFHLNYKSIDAPGADNRLCLYGRCRVCCKTLCIGFSIPEDKCGDDFLAKVYRWVDQLRRCRRVPPDGCNAREAFLRLFHEEDRLLVQAWLERTEVWRALI